MISPEEYYEEHLRGKTAGEIMTAIRGLKKEIGHIKYMMEKQHYEIEAITEPNESTRLRCDRLYLEKAKEALAEAGGVYEPSRAEKKALDFEKNIPFINKVIFDIGGYFDGYEKRTFTLDDENIYMDVEHSLLHKPADSEVQPDHLLSKKKFLDGIRELHIGEWRTNYDTERFGYVVMDGTQWELEIQFSNGHKPLKIHGNNVYPYNFDALEQLFGIARDKAEDGSESEDE